MSYFHISPLKNKKSILKNGLKSNDGTIFLFTDIMQENNIAVNQLFISEYSVFEILTEGISGELEEDNVTDIGSEYQVILMQDLIEAKYIKHISDIKKNIYDAIEAVEYPKYKAMGFTDEQYIDMLRIYPERLARYNEVNGTDYKPK